MDARGAELGCGSISDFPARTSRRVKIASSFLVRFCSKTASLHFSVFELRVPNAPQDHAQEPRTRFRLCAHGRITNMPTTENASLPRFFYGTAWKEQHTQELTELALRIGFRAVDTANQRRHYVEEAVGQALARAYADGIVARSDLFLQTKFTYRYGQDHRLPYDPSQSLTTQVSQSLASSLQHLGIDCADSFLLHGPASGHQWSDYDAEVWQAMVEEQRAGHTRLIGVSNVSLRHLQQMVLAHDVKAAFVQNRCFASLGWDRDVRAFCREHNIVYQGFSLLTANAEVLHFPLVQQIAARAKATPAQVIFSFAHRVGILPLTGTSNQLHMEQDLQAFHVELSEQHVMAIESLAG
jgi:diketogulonate reductase-like aldo/keto reductase